MLNAQIIRLDGGADIERWHRKAYYFQDMLEGK
jgi:hypothetical protein